MVQINNKEAFINRLNEELKLSLTPSQFRWNDYNMVLKMANYIGWNFEDDTPIPSDKFIQTKQETTDWREVVLNHLLRNEYVGIVSTTAPIATKRMIELIQYLWDKEYLNARLVRTRAQVNLNYGRAIFFDDKPDRLRGTEFSNIIVFDGVSFESRELAQLATRLG
jgi:hypothetical protein